jgi:hypothetical protein
VSRGEPGLDVPGSPGRYRGLVTNSASRDGDFSYDVALSFAGEQRAYVQKVAAALRRRGIRPFYDDYEKVELWGKDRPLRALGLGVSKGGSILRPFRLGSLRAKGMDYP